MDCRSVILDHPHHGFCGTRTTAGVSNAAPPSAPTDMLASPPPPHGRRALQLLLAGRFRPLSRRRGHAEPACFLLLSLSPRSRSSSLPPAAVASVWLPPRYSVAHRIVSARCRAHAVGYFLLSGSFAVGDDDGSDRYRSHDDISYIPHFFYVVPPPLLPRFRRRRSY